MAAVVEQNNTVVGNIFGDSTEALAYGAGLTVGRVSFVMITQNNQVRTVSSVTDDGGNTYSQVRTQSGNAGRIDIWRAVVTTTGTTVTVTLSGSNSDANSRISIFEVSGLDTAALDDQENSANNSPAVTTHPSGDITVAVTEAFVLAGLFGTTGTYTNDGDFVNHLNTTRQTIGYILSQAAATINYTVTSSASEESVVAIASFKVTTGGGGGGQLVRPIFKSIGIPYRRSYP